MTLTIELEPAKEAELNAKAEKLGVRPEQYARQVLEHDLETGTGSDSRHIGEVIREIWSDVPDEEMAELPRDGASQVDHYVYGLPKRDQ